MKKIKASREATASHYPDSNGKVRIRRKLLSETVQPEGRKDRKSEGKRCLGAHRQVLPLRENLPDAQLAPMLIQQRMPTLSRKSGARPPENKQTPSIRQRTPLPERGRRGSQVMAVALEAQLPCCPLSRPPSTHRPGRPPAPAAPTAAAPAVTMGGSFSRSGSFPFLSSGAAAATAGGAPGERSRAASLMSGRAAEARGGGGGGSGGRTAAGAGAAAAAAAARGLLPTAAAAPPPPPRAPAARRAPARVRAPPGWPPGSAAHPLRAPGSRPRPRSAPAGPPAGAQTAAPRHARGPLRRRRGAGAGGRLVAMLVAGCGGRATGLVKAVTRILTLAFPSPGVAGEPGTFDPAGGL